VSETRYEKMVHNLLLLLPVVFALYAVTAAMSPVREPSCGEVLLRIFISFLVVVPFTVMVINMWREEKRVYHNRLKRKEEGEE